MSPFGRNVKSVWHVGVSTRWRRVRYHAPLRVSEKSVKQGRCQSSRREKVFSGFEVSIDFLPKHASNRNFTSMNIMSKRSRYQKQDARELPNRQSHAQELPLAATLDGIRKNPRE
jgi:hypothetical protein